MQVFVEFDYTACYCL